MPRQYHVLSGLIRDLRHARADRATVWEDWLDELETSDEFLDDVEDVRPERDGSADDLRADPSITGEADDGNAVDDDAVDGSVPLAQPGTGSRRRSRLAAPLGGSQQPTEVAGLPSGLAGTGGAKILRTRVTRG